jgi:hypothetical protein
VSEFTRPATWDDLKEVARHLADEGVDYALIGGYALAAHGFNRFSEDLDLLVDPAPANTARWIRALSLLPDGACKELAGEDDIFQREGPYAIRINDEFTVDVMAAACGHGWEELSGFIQEIDLDGVRVRVLGLEGLLLTKQGMRDKDRMDAAVLRQALDSIKGG